ncbi:MAG: (p)ppGpp synthetase, partial [Methanococcaceae archaeon]
KMNYLILDAYRDLLKEIAVSDIDSFLTRNSFLHEVIKSKTTISLLYRQPIILFLYFLIKMRRNVCKNNWPLTDEELRPLFTDLGIAFERN